ncbi:MAG: phosphatidylserine/phosphatidylglycerophosphate/cardiolipin synthase family protein [Deltaproteobacteria bacterium]|nr:phosphatidylserine/phosphatidylglycerophosphate/cardiolipin synthase family protein [Deltaproteobacteria bacterium]
MSLFPKVTYESGLQFRPEIVGDAKPNDLAGAALEKWLQAACEELERRNIKLRLPGREATVDRDYEAALRTYLHALPAADRHDAIEMLDDLVKDQGGLRRPSLLSFIPMSVDLTDQGRLSDKFSLNDGRRNYGSLLETGEQVRYKKTIAEWALDKVEQAIADSVIASLEHDAADRGLETLGRLAETGSLRKVVYYLLKFARASDSEIERNDLVNLLAGFVEAELRRKGTTAHSFGIANPHYPRRFETWAQLSARLRTEFERAPKELPVAERLSRLVRTVELDGSASNEGIKPTDGNRVTVLADGDQAFDVRMKLLEGAEHSIRLMTWAIYDDNAGNAVADVLARKASEGKKVQVIVDGQIAASVKHHEMLDRMAAAGVQVVRVHEPDEPYFGNHRKAMLVDDRVAVVGGVNIGDPYFWTGGPDETKWQDSDDVIEGPAVADTLKLFASVWNRQVSHPPPAPDSTQQPPRVHAVFPKIAASEIDAARASCTPVTSGERVWVIDHAPGRTDPVTGATEANILKTYVTLIEAAKDSIDIDQAYFLRMDPVHDALIDALKRGVRVRILTNGRRSIDVPSVAGPIMAGMHELEALGAEIYLKRGHPHRGADAAGDTEHSKFMVVDGRNPVEGRPIYTVTGSYNLHWRSYTTEGENVVVVESAADAPASAGRTHTEMFESRVTPDRARRVSSEFLRRGSRDFMTRLMLIADGQI